MEKCTHHHDFEAQLLARGIKPTKHRCKLLNLLHKHERLSADELATHAGSKMNRVTVYRILAQLHARGVLSLDHGANGAMRYSLLDHHRHTITCTSCNRTEEIGSFADECIFESVERKAQNASKLFKVITSHSLHLFGTCVQCGHA